MTSIVEMQMTVQRLRDTKGSKADKAVLYTMAEWPLEPGQMLLLGPKSVKSLSSGAYKGPRTLTDLMVLERKDWKPKT